jgi:hypothetical protein
MNENENATKNRRWPWVITGIVVSSLVGYGIGQAGSETLSADPVPTVTVTAEPETMEVAPQVCLDALDTAQIIFGEFRELSELMANSANASIAAVRAAAAQDADGMNMAADDINAITDDINAVTDNVVAVTDDWHAQSSGCRAAAT